MSGAGQGGRRGGRGGRGGGGGGGAGPSSSKELSFLMQRIRLPIELETDDDADDLVDPTDPKRWASARLTLHVHLCCLVDLLVIVRHKAIQEESFTRDTAPSKVRPEASKNAFLCKMPSTILCCVETVVQY